jgi:hypothetical protein
MSPQAVEVVRAVAVVVESRQLSQTLTHTLGMLAELDLLLLSVEAAVAALVVLAVLAHRQRVLAVQVLISVYLLAVRLLCVLAVAVALAVELHLVAVVQEMALLAQQILAVVQAGKIAVMVPLVALACVLLGTRCRQC